MTITRVSLKEDYYQRTHQSCSPFGKRQIQKLSAISNRPGKLTLRRSEWYELLVVNNKTSYKINPNYSLCGDRKKFKSGLYLTTFLGDSEENHFLSNIYLNGLLQRVKSNFDRILEEARQIRSICAKRGYMINEYQTFMSLNQKKDFLNLLEVLITNESPFKFDLLISCITQFAQKHESIS